LDSLPIPSMDSLPGLSSLGSLPGLSSMGSGLPGLDSLSGLL
jgi:hypothetical protein